MSLYEACRRQHWTPRGRSSIWEQRDNRLTLICNKFFSPVAWDTQWKQFTSKTIVYTISLFAFQLDDRVAFFGADKGKPLLTITVAIFGLIGAVLFSSDVGVCACVLPLPHLSICPRLAPSQKTPSLTYSAVLQKFHFYKVSFGRFAPLRAPSQLIAQGSGLVGRAPTVDLRPMGILAAGLSVSNDFPQVSRGIQDGSSPRSPVRVAVTAPKVSGPSPLSAGAPPRPAPP